MGHTVVGPAQTGSIASSLAPGDDQLWSETFCVSQATFHHVHNDTIPQNLSTLSGAWASPCFSWPPLGGDPGCLQGYLGCPDATRASVWITPQWLSLASVLWASPSVWVPSTGPTSLWCAPPRGAGNVSTGRGSTSSSCRPLWSTRAGLFISMWDGLTVFMIPGSCATV